MNAYVNVFEDKTDLLVLDHHYLTVPADRIKDIKPLITMVGGKLVYQGARP